MLGSWSYRTYSTDLANILKCGISKRLQLFNFIIFVAIQGELILKLLDKNIHMKQGDSYIVAKGLEHTTVNIRDAKDVV